MCSRLHSRKKKKVGTLFLLIYGVSLQAHLCWLLFFMKIDGNLIPIGVLDYGRMRSCAYIKDNDSTRSGLSGGGLVSQPHFWKSVRMKLTFPKWGLGSPPRLPKFQSLITRVKTPRIEAFFITLESY